MRIFLAGATGAVGTPLLHALVRAGHDVTATTRSAGKADALRAAGAEPVVLDALDRDAVVAAVTAARPDTIVHQLTGLGAMGSMRQFDRAFAVTNRLRTAGTDNLLAGARAAGGARIVAQSYAGWPYARTGGPIKTEEDPLDPDPVPSMRESFAAIRHVESAVTAVQGVALRYGAFYGPGTGLDSGGEQVGLVRKRRFPVVGSGTGVWSFIHVEDAASATVAAIDRAATGVYNVVDDDPAPAREWLPALAAAAGAPPPRRVPRWLGRLAAGEAVAALMTEVRGASNAKARRELGWAPVHASWRDGFPATLA